MKKGAEYWFGLFIGIALHALFWWIVAVGFANYGICTRTVIAFIMVLVGGILISVWPDTKDNSGEDNEKSD